MTQISKILNITTQGTLKLLKRLNAPMTYVNRYWVLNDGDLYRSLILSKRLKLPSIFTMKQLSRLLSLSRQQTLQLIRETDLKIYGSTKKYVLLCDLQKLKNANI